MKFIDLNPHRTWLSIVALGVASLLITLPLAKYVSDKVHQRAGELAAQRFEIETSVARFNDDMHLAQQQNGKLSVDEVDRLLAPVDRLHVVAEMEQLAASSHLSHFTYTLQPEKKPKNDMLDAANFWESELNLTADAPLDTDIYAFINHLSPLLPGRVHLRQLLLSRISADAPISMANIHMEASLVWLSNGSTNMVEAGTR